MNDKIMQFSLILFVLTCLLHYSVSLETTALNGFKSNNSLFNSTTNFDVSSKINSSADIKDGVLSENKTAPIMFTHSGILQKDNVKQYGRLRNTKNIRLQREKNRPRKLKETSNSTTPQYSIKKKRNDEILSQDKLNDSTKSFRRNVSLERSKDQIRPQRNRKYFKARDTETTVSKNNVTSSKSFLTFVTSTPFQPTNQFTRLETTTKVVYKKSSDSRSKNRPQRNRHGRKHVRDRRHKTIFSLRPKPNHKIRPHTKYTSKKTKKERARFFSTSDRGTKPSKATKSGLSGKPLTATSSDCPTCGSNDFSEENVRQIRLEMFINTVAEKLRVSPDKLMERHKKRVSPPFPRNLLDETLQDNAMQGMSDGFFAKDQKVILSGNDLGRNCIAKATSGCYNFDLAGKIKGDVASAQLWLYKTPDRNDSSVQTFFLYGLERLRSGRVLAQNQIQRQDSYVREGWVVINVKRTVTSWVQERKSAEMIAIRCATCVTRNHKALYGAKHGYKPLIIIKYDSTSLQSRYRRSYDNCDPRYECCKRRLEINFRNIHMHTVEAPPDLSVGYCYGHCNDIHQHTYNHTMVKQMVRFVDENTSQGMREELKPCCVPIALKSAFLLMRSQNAGTLTVVPNTIVEQCGCI